MSSTRIQVFFYGSFISLDVLGKAGLVPRHGELARAWGWDIQIGPLANVVRSDRHCVYGLVCDASHAELARLYGQDWVGSYLPEAVLIETANGSQRPALWYVAPPTRSTPPSDDYVGRIVDAGRELGFPEWYLERLESFRRQN